MENKEQNLKERSKQTAVEWFESQLEQQAMISVYAFEDQLFCRKLIQQAKAIEKEQKHETKQYWFGRGVLAEKENRIEELMPKPNGRKKYGEESTN